MAGHTAIITACAHEAALVRRRLHVQQQVTGAAGLLWQGVLHQQEVVLLQCGMGLERAAQAVRWLGQHYQLAGVLSVGFAGGLQAELRPGDALLVTRILAQADVARTASLAADSGIRPDARLAHIAAMAVAQAAVVSHTGTLLSTTAVMAQAAVKQALGQHSGALAVDMESYSVGQMAAQNHIPFAVLRTIFDTSCENMSLPVATWTTADGSLRPFRLGGCLACRPWLLLQLPHWWWASQVAGRHLQRWLQHFFLLLSQGA
jgi:adenosylhomocysteine nucleosidase